MNHTRELDIGSCCEIRRSLAASFATAARIYAEAVVLLTISGVADPQKYQRMLQSVEDAQEKAHRAAAQFREHVDSHRCCG